MKKLCVFLDNGHGSNTPGKCSPDKSILEYLWCREITSMLKLELDKLGIKNEIIVPEIIDISLTQRVKRTNTLYKKYKTAGYDCILISIHINAAGGDGKWHNATGWSGWVSKNASSNSKKLALLLYDEATKLNLKGNRCVPPTKYWEANFTILTRTNCPAVLTENLFQDNKDDVKILLSKEGKDKIIKLHIEGIKKYINQ